MGNSSSTYSAQYQQVELVSQAQPVAANDVRYCAPRCVTLTRRFSLLGGYSYYELSSAAGDLFKFK